MKEKCEMLAPGREDARSRLARRLAFAAAAAAIAFGTMLGVRTIVTPDLGYHLAYGDHFLDTGRIVDFDLGVYPTISSAAATRELGPGCWYDPQGHYRFPNANWLSQVLMSAVHRAAGPNALSVLLALQVAAVLALMAGAMRRLGVGWLGVAAGIALAALTAYERFDLRPELLGYVILMGQLYVLVGAMRTRDLPRSKLAWVSILLVALQVLLVNVHSYFLLGLGLTGAVLADRFLRWAWARKRGDPVGTASFAVAAKWLGLVLLAQGVACFVNPWTWRLAALPFQTLAFIRVNAIAEGTTQGLGHPWSVIGEFFRPFAIGVFSESKATRAFIVLLGVLCAGLAAAAWRRRWAHVLMIAGMIATGLQMRRNIAVCALVATPLAFASLRDLLAPLASRAFSAKRPAAASAGALFLLLACAFGAYMLLSHNFYASERREIRFGLGLSPIAIPLNEADWINANMPAGRLWTDINSSSNMYYFTRPRRDVPVLTNTWAATPEVMGRVLDYMAARRPFAEAVATWDVGAVTLYMDGSSVPLARQLAADPNWAVVHVGAPFVVFLRAAGPNAALARRAALTPDTLDVKALAERVRRTDPVHAYPLYLAGFTLNHIGWDTPAIALFDEALRADPRYVHRHFVLTMKGVSLARRGTLRMLQDPPDRRGIEDWHEARRCFIQAEEFRRDYEAARVNKMLVEQQIADERRGILHKHPW